MSTAFLTNAAAVTGIATSYAAGKVITLSMAPTVDPGCSPTMPGACFLDHIELVGTAGGVPPPTSLTAVLSWAATGDDIFTGEASVTLIPGITSGSLVCVGIPIQAWIRFPDGVTTRLIHLFVKVNQGTLDLAIGGVRLIWTTDYVNQS